MLAAPEVVNGVVVLPEAHRRVADGLEESTTRDVLVRRMVVDKVMKHV